MKAKELQEKTKVELENMLKELRMELFQLRFDASARQVKNYKKIPSVKRDIARVLTIMKTSK